MNEHEFTIIGVTTNEFGSTFSGAALDVWTPVMMKDYVARPHFSLTDRSSRWLMIMGRLRPGVTVDLAQSNIATVAGRLAQTFPQTNEQLGVEVHSLTRSPYGLRRTMRPALAMLMAVVALVLLIACANVANLLIARANSRRKEIAIRLALGASRKRLARQLLTESLVLAGLGGLSGLLLAFWTARSLKAFLPPFGLAVSFDTSPDARVLGFTLAVTVITGLLFGLVPALQASRPDLVSTLKDDPGAVGRSQRKLSLRHLLVVAQVALSVLALVGAGLFVRSLRKAQMADPGFNAGGVVLASFDPFLNGYDETKGREFYRRLIERVEVTAGMQSVSLARRLPLTLSGIAFATLTIEGYTPGRDEDMRVNYETVGPKYFRTMGIRLARGRDFNERDNERAPGVVIINETMARRYWPDRDAMGQRLKLGKDWLEIVGIASEVKQRRLNEPPQPFLYLPLLQDYRSNMILVARTALELRAALPAVENVVATLDPNLPIFDVKTLNEHIGVSLFLPRMAATLLSLFGLLALSLAALGLYGVMSYSVSQRTREIGIRISLGAQRRDVLKLILKQGLTLSLIGLAGGLAAALVVTRLIAHLLYGVSANDPATYTLIALLLTGVALVACYLPARRATKVDPMIALRYDC
ncbi:MAG: ABC transporter permease [Blastocatellia bacterium]